MRPLNVMHIVLDLGRGGMEKFVADLLLRFDPAKVRSSVCCIDWLGEFSERLKEAGIEVHLLPKTSLGKLRFYRALKNIFIEKEIDVAHSYSGVYRDAVISSILAGVPINVHTDQGRFYPDPQSKMARLNHWFFSHFRDKVIAVSEELHTFLIGDVRLNPDKVTTIYNAVDVDDYSFKIDSNKKKRQLGLSIDKKIIGIVARLVPVKDHKTLFAAFKKVRQSIPMVTLLIVGEGPLGRELKNYARELGEDNSIVFLGERSDVKELLHIMDVVCLSSLHEGLSLTLLEAMASARPVVATNVGGNAELVIDGTCGFLVPPKNPDKMAEALVKLLNDEEKRRSMGEMAKRRVTERFNIKNTVRQYEDLYLDLVRRKGLFS